ncbi:hypothetical protein [Streptomyces sp. NPDC051657]|uniref:hypothetical protein n=1 Tax=unclassified Streptomyces TaxID=2593676 RepID=UPI003420C390
MPFRDPTTSLPFEDMEGQIGSGQIEDGAVILGKLGPSAVEAANIADQAVNAAKLADQAVTAGKLAALAVGSEHLAALAVSAEKIAANAVTTSAIAAGSVVNASLGTSAVTASKIAANAVNASEISAGAVVAGKIAAGAVVAGNIDAGAVVAGNIAAGTVTATELAAGAVTAGKITAGAIVAADIAAGAIIAGKIAANAVTAGTIEALAVTTSKLAANAVTADKILAGAITAEKLDANAITGKTITGGTVTGATVQTAATGRRVVLNTSGIVSLWSGRAAGETPGTIESGITSDGEMELGYLTIKPPTHGPTPPEITMAVGPTGERQWRAGPLAMLEDGATSAANILGDLYVSGSIEMGSGTVFADPGWNALSFASGWTGYGSTFGSGRYRLMPDGSVVVRDLAKRTATTALVNGEVIGTLPVGYRPTTQFQVNQWVGSATGGILSLNVNTTGQIVMNNISAGANTYLGSGTGYLSLNQIQFWLD